MTHDNIVSAAAYLFAKGNDGEWCVLCGKRSGNSIRHQGGLFDVPVGMREEGESILETALREVLEETGISLRPTDIRFVEKQRWGQGKVGSNFIGIFEQCLSIGRGDFEHELFKWIPIDSVGQYQWAFDMGSKIMELFNRFVNNQQLNENISKKKMKRIRLTESDLHKIVANSVKKVLSELKWTTYADAAKEADNRGNKDLAKRFRDHIYDTSARKKVYNGTTGAYDTASIDFDDKNNPYPAGYSRDILGNYTDVEGFGDEAGQYHTSRISQTDEPYYDGYGTLDVFNPDIKSHYSELERQAREYNDKV